MRRRRVIAAAALVAWIAGSTLGTVTLKRAVAQPLLVIGKAHASYTPSLTGNKPIFILVIGSGARPGDDVVHSLADSIHLVGINPALHEATILNIPRDSWVNIPGYGSNKINAAMTAGGPPLLIQTIESLTGIKIGYYALTTFWGMTTLINNVKGLTVDVPCAMVDHYSGANLQAGVQHLNGHDVLAFSRDRHSLLSGDFGRTTNAGSVILAALAQFRKEYTKNPSALLTWLGAGLRNIQTDIPLSELLDLAFTAYQIKVPNVQNVTLPGSTGMQGSLSVVYISATATKIFRDLKPDGVLEKVNVPPSPLANGC